MSPLTLSRRVVRMAACLPFLIAGWASAEETATPGKAETLVPYRGPEGEASAAPRRVLRVPADPNNLPFTNNRLEGFENKIAALLAQDLGADLVYEWRAQRRGFFRQSLKEGDCNLVLGVPVGSERALTTEPYYTSTYCFVYRKDRGLAIETLDDPVLRDLKIGIELIGDDGANPPPAHALAARGIVGNVVGFTVYGDYAQPNPPARVVDAVANGDVDVALVWGPRAGYFARHAPVEMEVVPVRPALDRAGLPFVFSISLGVRQQDRAFRDELNGILRRERDRINQILDEYGVPRAEALPAAGPTPDS